MSNSAAHQERRRARAAWWARGLRSRRPATYPRNRYLTIPRDEFRQVVEKLTNRQRKAWNAAKCPGQKERDAEAVLPFLVSAQQQDTDSQEAAD